MTARRKSLPPPAADPVTALLASRFSAPDDQADETPAPPAPPAAPAGAGDHQVVPDIGPVATTPPAAPSGARPRRREPAGMTRRTFYLPSATAAELDEAAGRMLAATRGRITKAEALAAIIAAGVSQADAALDRLRAGVLRDLG